MRAMRPGRWMACLLVLATASCASRPQRYQDAKMDFGAIRTVAVMPFANLSQQAAAGDRVRDVFANMLLATGAVYVLPLGEVSKAVGRLSIQTPGAPSIEEIVKLGQALKADAIITGTVKEYGEVRSGTASAPVASVSTQMFEATTGKAVWAASTTKGGLSFGDRLLGSGGSPLNDVTEAAVLDLLEKLFK
jgi:hypothetical protein